MNKIFISALFLGATAMGYAQETNEISGNGAHNIEEVTITTNRIVEKKTDAIANVTVIDGKTTRICKSITRFISSYRNDRACDVFIY